MPVLHPEGISAVLGDDLPGEVLEECVVLLGLFGAPAGPGLDGLESPVVGEGVVQDMEFVTGHVHLVRLEKSKSEKST